MPRRGGRARHISVIEENFVDRVFVEWAGAMGAQTIRRDVLLARILLKETEMPRLTLLITALTIGVIAYAGQAKAAACIDGTADVPKEFGASDYVIKGKVIAIDRDKRIKFEYQGKEYSDLVDRVAVRVERNYKRPSNSVIYFDNTQDSASFPVSIGKRYILFLQRNSPADELHVGSCGSSSELRGSGWKALAQVKDLSHGERRRLGR